MSMYAKIIADTLQSNLPAWVEPAFLLFASLGGAVSLVLLALTIYFLKHRMLAMDLLWLLLFISLVCTVLQWVLRYSPPSETYRLAETSLYAFPDPMVARATGAAIFLSYFLEERRMRYTAFALLVLVSFSRVYSGVSYPRDVLGGVVVGVFSVFAVSRLIRFLRPAAREIDTSSHIAFAFAAVLGSFALLKIFVPGSPAGAVYLGLFGGGLLGHFLARKMFPELKSDPASGAVRRKDRGVPLLILFALAAVFVGIYRLHSIQWSHHVLKDAATLFLGLLSVSLSVVLFHYSQSGAPGEAKNTDDESPDSSKNTDDRAKRSGGGERSPESGDSDRTKKIEDRPKRSGDAGRNTEVEGPDSSKKTDNRPKRSGDAAKNTDTKGPDGPDNANMRTE